MVIAQHKLRRPSARPNTISLLSMVMGLPMRGRNSGASYGMQKPPRARNMPFDSFGVYSNPKPRTFGVTPPPGILPTVAPEPEKPVDRFDAIIEEMNDGKKRKRKEGIQDSIRKWWGKASGPSKTSTVPPTDEDQKVGEVSRRRIPRINWRASGPRK